jgi:hypothetical protein
MYGMFMMCLPVPAGTDFRPLVSVSSYIFIT